MVKPKHNYKIKVTKDGPYIVTGNVPLSEKIIAQTRRSYVYREGRELPQAETYALCRCGKTKTPPFCDGSHTRFDFDGEETASKAKFTDRAEFLEGPGLDLLDDHRCAFARFCHRPKGNVWDLVDQSDNAESKSEAIIAASECPSGRLVAVEKSGEMIEPELEPGIDILQDPLMEVSGGIYVRGYIPIESADGNIYEVRNRVALCRCGNSNNMPFCDMAHIDTDYNDQPK